MSTGPQASSPSPPIQILLVDDNPVDVAFTCAALKHARLANELSVACDGVDALARMRAEPPYEHTPQPHMLLLDLDMPKMDGQTVLREMRGDERLRKLPVVVLTSAVELRDELMREDVSHEARFILKPLKFDEFIRAIATFDVFGLRFRRVGS